MFQDFSSSADPALAADRVARLRARLAALGVDAVLVPRSDEHMGEYVPPSAERLAWLTGFTGSAGLAVIAAKKAALFVDGRYTLQAADQVDTSIFDIVQIPETEPRQWLAENLPKGARIGFDPWLHTRAAIARFEEGLAKAGLVLKPLARNPVDLVWGAERPGPPQGALSIQPLEWAGVSAADKIKALQRLLKGASEDAVVLTLPDSIAWLFNVRGSDVNHNPTPLAFAVVPVTGKPELFIDKAKIGPEVRKHLSAVTHVRAPEALAERLTSLRHEKKRVRLDTTTANMWIWQRLGGARGRISDASDPCILPKARKNEAEIRGMRIAHERDGIAVTRFLAWIDREAPKGSVDEISAVRTLEAMRAETQALKEISFDTISGSGPNGAIVHYRVTEATNRQLRAGELFLVDSGGQYIDGTTDITRTVVIGAPTAEMRDRFTRVLKGHIAISELRFPAGTTGAHIDVLARHALWQAGFDFDHGTGHGVGSYLSVHEGPQSISKRGHVVLEPGMILSNEPGYYKTGAYGIRIENLLLIYPPAALPGGEREMLGFETLTLVPIDRRLIDPALLSAGEFAWINAYHARVAAVVGPHLNDADRTWLAQATAPIAHS
ncbi:MAG: aminopeptidase P family protein [Hyphomicrobium sp.]|nr:aminopeptidase P family protein [Hyphomicrobium sp.]